MIEQARRVERSFERLESFPSPLLASITRQLRQEVIALVRAVHTPSTIVVRKCQCWRVKKKARVPKWKNWTQFGQI